MRGSDFFKSILMQSSDAVRAFKKLLAIIMRLLHPELAK